MQLPDIEVMTKPWQQWQPPSPTPVRPQSALLPKERACLLTTEDIAWLWQELTLLYGTLFTSKNGTHDRHGVWFAALKGLTPKALESGMERLRDLSAGDRFCDFPPNCLQFKALCLAYYEELNLPKVHDAYREIKNFWESNAGYYSHAVVSFIARRLPDNFLAIKQEKVAYALFKRVYEQVTDLVRQGHAIPEVKDRVKRPRPSPNKAVAQTHLAQLKQLLKK